MRIFLIMALLGTSPALAEDSADELVGYFELQEEKTERPEIDHLDEIRVEVQTLSAYAAQLKKVEVRDGVRDLRKIQRAPTSSTLRKHGFLVQ